MGGLNATRIEEDQDDERLLSLMFALTPPRVGDVEVEIAPGVWATVDGVMITDKSLTITHERTDYVFPCGRCPRWRHA